LNLGFPAWTTAATGGGPVTSAMGTPTAAASVALQAQAADALRRLNSAKYDAKVASDKLAKAEADINSAHDAEADAARALLEARTKMRLRIVELYVQGGETLELRAQLATKDMQSSMVATQYASSASDAAHRDILRYNKLKAQSSSQAVKSAERVDALRADLEQASNLQLQAESELAQYHVQLESLAAPPFVFPVAGEFNFTDTFGAPRSTTVGWHQGTDVFAASGTPLVAVESGVLEQVGVNQVGGLRLWLVGASGNRYYYAHLAGFAPGVVDGLQVAAGQVVGYVGNTGNAATTPTHLHFEIRVLGSEAAVNPYPFLRTLATGGAPAQSRLVSAPADLLVLFKTASDRYGVPLALLVEQARAESGFNPAVISCQRASSAGAQGISQFMPQTAAAMGVNPCDVASAIDGQARLMKGHHDKFGSWALALAAYNAGGGRVSSCRCVPAISETQSYVAKILAAADMQLS
jgi:murein DD-endopeptidase MepM/ murein hydrolase activator NlpD